MDKKSTSKSKSFPARKNTDVSSASIVKEPEEDKLSQVAQKTTPGLKAKNPTPGKGHKVLGRRKKSRHETFGVYIYKVLKQVHSDTGISKKSMQIMNSFIADIFEKTALETTESDREPSIYFVRVNFNTTVYFKYLKI